MTRAAARIGVGTGPAALIRWGLGCGLALAVLTATAPAQPADAAAVLDAALEAHGGAEAVDRSARTIYRGSWDSIRRGETARSSELTVHAGLNGQVRAELTGPGLARTYVSNGEFGWVVQNGRKRPLPRRLAANRVFELNPLAGILRAHREGRLEVRSAEAVEGKGGLGLFRIVLTYRDTAEPGPLRGPLDRTYRVGVERTSRRVRSLTVYEPSRSTQRPDEPLLTYHYGDYREIEGLPVPFQVRIEGQFGETVAEVRLDAFETTGAAPDVSEP